ncbi:putative asparagine synthetase [Streptococcus pneumoniae]|nr:asparagine synthase-related protein [Streptococcus pneumoniae]MDS8737566.1 asparagine synthase-related protein [Streptococcus pneumoniae]VNV37478.1 putative asparagine synthetase [Streptococcus pneumoniae]VSQ75497.1 putative asparagine synthetase [Streptococcus pneumoniae]
MVNKYFFEKYSDKKIVFLTKNLYRTVSGENKKIYCLEDYVEGVCSIIEQNDISSFEEIISALQDYVTNGLIIVEMAERTYIISPYLDSRLSWFENNKNIIFSDSSVEIAKYLNLKLSTKRLASQFIFGLPYYPFQTISLWEELVNIRPLNYLEISEKGCLEKRVPSYEVDTKDFNKLIIKIKEEFLNSINHDLNMRNEVSSDVSGGVDSATIAFTLNKLIPDFSILHAESSATANSDTKWATFIAKSLGRELKKFDSIEITEKRFAIDEKYINDIMPSSPLLWADSEGYLKSVIGYQKGRKQPTHFLGIGGDELFTPMPSNSWNIVRQENLGGLLYALKYSLIMRRPFFSCLLDLLDNRGYSETVIKNLEIVFNESSAPIKRELGWVDGLQVPDWLSEKSKQESQIFLNSLLFSNSEPIISDRTAFQMIQSLIFQKSVLRQIQLTTNSIYWATPFLHKKLIEIYLQIPAKYKVSSKLTKPILQKALKGIVPIEVFNRGFKGDYSDALYSGYREAVRKNFHNLEQFELVKMGIIDVEKLKLEMSLPAGNPSKIDYFEKLCSVERWIRQIKLYMKN